MIRIIKFGFRYIRKSLYGCYLLVCSLISLVRIVSPLLMGAVINLLTGNQGMDKIGKMIIFFFLFSLFEMGISVLQSYVGVKLEAESGYEANKQFMKKLYHTSYLNIGMEDPAMLNQKINTDLNAIISFSIAFFRDMIRNILFVICIAVVLISKSLGLCLVLFTLVLCYALIYMLNRKKMYEVSYKLKESQTNFFGHMYSMVFFLKSIRNNGFENVSFTKLDQEFGKYYKILHHQVNVNIGFNTMIDMISLLAQIVLFFVGGKMVLDGRLSVGLLVAILNYFSMLLQSTDYFLNLGQSYQDTLSSYQRMQPYDRMEKSLNGERSFEQITRIELKNISFAYPGQKPLFCLNQKLEQGKIYWIKGKNGIGKTSLLNVLLGLFGEDYIGKIEVNKIPFDQIDKKKMISENVAIVEQEPFLLSDTLRNNLLCKGKGKEQEKELNRLLTLFGMDNFIKKQPLGLDTVYNSMNSAMSGGEKQKIVIIRMLLSSANVWFLDEPTASLDTVSNRHFYEELERQREGHIILMISHEIPKVYDEVFSF